MKIDRRRFLGMSLASAALAGCANGVNGGYPKVRSPLSVARLGGEIKHLVVLMMENRSYDQMLGALPGRKYAGPEPGTTVSYRGEHGLVDVPLRHGRPRDSFYPDPPHRFRKVQTQIFGKGPGTRADMGGFAQAFVDENPFLPMLAANVEEYMTHYDRGQLPILQTLAEEYATCTHWFSSLPGPTTPNRMFVHAGSSGGTVWQGLYYSRLRDKMIFDKLGNDDRLWRVYFHDIPHLWITGDIWAKAFAGEHRRIHRFRQDVQNDNLPVYTFIEPRHVIPPWNSQHPFWGVSHGEELIARVYNDLIENPRVFEKTLLLIVYDEHGGFYDHVVPPGHEGWNASDPTLRHDVVAPTPEHVPEFDFRRLGPRVPAVAISPWIERGSVFGWNAENPEDRHTFDHTSVLSTVGEMTGVWVDSARARSATPLSVTLNRMTPRTDASRLTFRRGAYHGASNRVATATSPEEIGGVGKELCDRFRAEHRLDATPEAIADYYASLVGA
jgi:phospholipase C